MELVPNIKNKIDICYFCGQKLKENIGDDHTPPKQFYAKNIRKIHNPNLLTLHLVIHLIKRTKIIFIIL